MNIEIERKFLVESESWRSAVVTSLSLRDGLIAEVDGRKMRVRICNGEGSITLNVRRKSLVRAELIYAVPHDEASELLRMICDGRI